MNRRVLLTGAAVATAGVAMTGASSKPASPAGGRAQRSLTPDRHIRDASADRKTRSGATFVLVHGAFHGGWCYARVVEKLRAEGHRVFAPTLTGLGNRAHLAGQAINLATHIEDIVSEIETNNLHDVILCGHSYAGMVITGVAGRLGKRIKTLFYLDAAVPEDGQSLFDLVGPARTAFMLAAAGNTGTMIAPLKAEFFNVDAENAAWVDRLLTPHPIATFIQKIRYTGKETTIPHRTFVLCERYNSANHETYRKLKDRAGWKLVSLDRGHDLMVNNPDELVALLLAETVI